MRAAGVPNADVIGSTPAHTGSARSSGGSSGQPALTLTDHSASGSRSSSGGRDFLGGRGPQLRPSPWHEVLGQHLQTAQRVVVRHDFARTEHHDAAVVHRRFERGSSEHQAVEEGDRQTGSLAVSQRAKQPAAGRSVHDDVLAVAPERNRQHIRLAVGIADGNVRNPGCVENARTTRRDRRLASRAAVELSCGRDCRRGCRSQVRPSLRQAPIAASAR